MKRFLAWFDARRPGRRRGLIALGLGTALLALFSPFLWAAYHQYMGLSAYQHYHSAEALEHLEACLRIWPWSHNSHLHVLAARAARREGKFHEEKFLDAERHLRICQDTLGENGPESESVFEWALLHAAQGDLDTVEEPLKSGLRKYPVFTPLILEALGEGYLRMSRVLDALRCADGWLTLNPDDAQAFLLRADIHRQVGASQKCAEDCRRVLELDPERHEARWWLAVALLEIGRYDEALGHLEVLHQRNPTDVDIRVRLAFCHHLLGRNAEARALLDGVLAEQPDNGLALLTRGQIVMRSGQLPEAETWLRRAATVLPYDYKTQWWLWECLRQEGKTQEAEPQRLRMEQIKDLRQRQSEIRTHLMSQRPGDPALQCELGTLYMKLGAPEVGERWLLHALALDANYIPALEALADYYQERGNLDQAEQYRQHIRQITEAQSPPTNSK